MIIMKIMVYVILQKCCRSKDCLTRNNDFKHMYKKEVKNESAKETYHTLEIHFFQTTNQYVNS